MTKVKVYKIHDMDPLWVVGYMGDQSLMLNKPFCLFDMDQPEHASKIFETTEISNIKTHEDSSIEFRTQDNSRYKITYLKKKK